jgi:catechol 2,3-dioxygenase-like lactoylglutathione lyase family enzyme
MRIHHLALRVTDLERSLAFYGGLLGLGELARQRAEGTLRSVWLAAGDTVLMLETRLAGRGPAEGSSHLLAFAVEDLEAWMRRLAEAGVIVEDRTRDTLYFRDPDGHRVGLSRYAISPPIA